MWSLFPVSLLRALQLWLFALKGLFDGRRSLRGRLLIFVAAPFFLVWQLLNWLGFLLDEILFPGYRWVEVKPPLFVLGPPRSGTTHLHRTLAEDPSYTTFRLWEGVFGLSVSGRRLFGFFRRLDRGLGRPIARLAGYAAARLGDSLDDIHALGPDEAEEDFLCLLPASLCFLLVVPFPQADWLWRVVKLDTDMRPNEQRAVLAYYRACVKKHLYAAGQTHVYLAKNPSFSGMVEGLLETFPGARVLACHRDPFETVPSQLSSLRPFLKACGHDTFPRDMRDRFVDLLRHDYLHLHAAGERHPGQIAFVDNTALRMHPKQTVTAALTNLDCALSKALSDTLDQQESEPRFESSHCYSLDEFDLDSDLLVSSFAPVYERFDYSDEQTREEHDDA